MKVERGQSYDNLQGMSQIKYNMFKDPRVGTTLICSCNRRSLVWKKRIWGRRTGMEVGD